MVVSRMIRYFCGMMNGFGCAVAIFVPGRNGILGIVPICLSIIISLTWPKPL